MKNKLLLLFVILFTLNNSNAQDIQLVNKIVGNDDPVNYYIGHFPVSGSDGLDLHWYGGIRFGDQTSNSVMQITNGKVGIGITNPSYTLQVVGATGISEDLALGGNGRSVNWSNFSYGSYIDLNNSQNALRVRDKNNTIMLEVNGSNNYFTGNVGIGTTNPQSKLDIDFGGEPKSIKFLEYANALSSMNSLMRFTWYNDTADFGMIRSGGTPIEALAIRFNNVEKMRFMSNGNVGIGTTTPSVKLEIAGDAKINGTLNVSGTNALNFSNYGGGLYMLDDSWIRTYGDKNFYHNTGIMRTDGIFQVGPNGDRLVVSTNGNVGIGSLYPDQKLTVKGKIHAEEIIVDLAVPADYVFQKYYTGKSELKSDYSVPTLAEIESFTKKNHHLPNVPSAQEIKQNGLSLGEMSNVLLQKVEELTLYAIEQNKVIEELKIQVATLMAKKQ